MQRGRERLRYTDAPAAGAASAAGAAGSTFVCGIMASAPGGVEESTAGAGAARVRWSIATRSSEKMVDTMAQPKPLAHNGTLKRLESEVLEPEDVRLLVGQLLMRAHEEAAADEVAPLMV